MNKRNPVVDRLLEDALLRLLRHPEDPAKVYWSFTKPLFRDSDPGPVMPNGEFFRPPHCNEAWYAQKRDMVYGYTLTAEGWKPTEDYTHMPKAAYKALVVRARVHEAFLVGMGG